MEMTKVKWMNLGTIFFNNYLLIIFTDYVTDPNIREFFGWLQSIAIVLVVGINISLVMGQVIKAILVRAFLKCKELCKEKARPEPIAPEPTVAPQQIHNEGLIDLSDPL